MPFEFKKLDIEGVVLIKPIVFSDDRGFFMETYKYSDFVKNGIKENFVQDNHSKSVKNVLRGIHFQLSPKAQGKLVRCTKGKIFDVAVDLRTNSPTFKKWVGVELSEKNKYMLEWWEKTFELFIEFGLTKEKIKNAVFNWSIDFRDWVEYFCKNLYKNNIPLIIISASWLGKYWVQYFLERENIFFKNIEIISNNFIWDKKWKAIWYNKPIIHSFNKSETILKNNEKIYSKIENRKNVILLWDSLWDHHMVDWFEYKNLIKIWFLNDITHPSPLFTIEGKKDSELLEAYKKRYDIIITWDWDFDIVNKIMEEIK